MPLNYARQLTGKDRTRNGNRHLGWTLAFVAGATNAGAFLAVKQYTSHMTGMLSSMADNLVLGDIPLVAGALGGLASFLIGAATSAVLVSYARRHQLKSQFALPLLLEAGLLLLFGIMGGQLATIDGLFVPCTVMLLCFIMGLQNAVITKISKAEIRTTHVTGLVTDIGIELGKFVYWSRLRGEPSLRVQANKSRLLVLSTMVFAFALGGVIGAIGFQRIGYATTVPLALLLVLIASVPAADDIKDYLSRRTASS